MILQKREQYDSSFSFLSLFRTSALLLHTCTFSLLLSFQLFGTFPLLSLGARFSSLTRTTFILLFRATTALALFLFLKVLWRLSLSLLPPQLPFTRIVPCLVGPTARFFQYVSKLDGLIRQEKVNGGR